MIKVVPGFPVVDPCICTSNRFIHALAIRTRQQKPTIWQDMRTKGAVAITIPPVWPCTSRVCHWCRRIVPLRRPCARFCTQRSICVLHTGSVCGALANYWRDSQPTCRACGRAGQQCPSDLGRRHEYGGQTVPNVSRRMIRSICSISVRRTF
jgi:hypothetical protein